MRSTIPNVIGGRLYRSETESDPIVVGTPEWYDWLEQHAAFTFVDAAGSFTVRKSMLHTGGSYWKAYRTRRGKLYRIHLGHSQSLTLERLQATARAFASEHVPGELADVAMTQSPASRLPSPRNALTVEHPMALIQTKLYRPRKRSDLISRARLLERLHAGLSGNITLISAPAGFGKTTLIAQWIQSIDRPTAWLSLDEHDNEPRAFVQSLTAALQSAFPEAFHGVASLVEAPRFPSVEHVVPLFINDLADLPDDLILVLDDYHLMRTRDIHTLLEGLIEHVPPQLHLVLATRTDPPLPIHRWRANGYLNELRPADLRFTLEETEAFLTQELGSSVAHETAVSLEERTGGWIAIVRLAALTLRTTADPAVFMEQLQRYPEHSIQSYLVEEVLAQLAPAVQELLVKTSVLEQFCAELCTAILGSETSLEHVQVTLNWLERSNVFIIRLDERQGWYRFHHLFGQLVKQRLQALSSAEELAMLHRRASMWYAEQGLIEHAIEHALATGDVPGATSLVEAQFLPAFEQEQWVQLELWLRLLPEEQIQGSPVLLFAQAWILQVQGQLKDLPRLLTTAEQLLDASSNDVRNLEDPHSRLLHALIATLWSLFQYFTGQEQASLASARSALEWLPPGEEYVASTALVFLALSTGSWAGRHCTCCTATGAERPFDASQQHCAPALCSGMGLSGCRQIAPGRTHCETFAPGRSGGSYSIESKFCSLVPGCGVLRVAQPGCSNLSLLSRDRQPAPGALVGGAGRYAWPGPGLSNSRVGLPSSGDRARAARIGAGAAQYTRAHDGLCFLWTDSSHAGRGGAGRAVARDGGGARSAGSIDVL